MNRIITIVWTILMLILSGSSLAENTSGSGAEVKQTIAEQQKEQVAAIVDDMNKSAKEVANTIISEPQKAIDSGCLADIQGIDLSVFTVDLTNIWGAMYKTIKDQIVNTACTESTEWANAKTEDFDYVFVISEKYDVGGIEGSQGGSVDEWQSIVDSEAELNNEDVASKATDVVLGDIPKPAILREAMKPIIAEQETAVHTKDIWEEKMEDSLDLNSLWGDEEEE